MKAKVYLLTTAIAMLFLLAPLNSLRLTTAEAQGLGSLLGGGGGEVVRIISDVSEPAITSALRNTITALNTTQTSLDVAQLILKEKILDPTAWGLGKQLQQQLTAEMLKFLGGQQPGQNGQVPFVQNYSEYYQNLTDQIVGDYIYNNRAGDTDRQCSTEKSNKVLTATYNSYIDARQKGQGGGALQCGEDNVGDYDNLLDQLLGDFLECRDDACAYFAGQRELALRNERAIQYERDAVNNARGFKPQRVCTEVEDADGRVRQRCDIVNPPSLAADAASFNLVELPGLQLLNIDEFDEIVSNLMSNLTNQAINGVTGVLGLSGNPDYGQSVFGDTGNLSYADALARDDISRYQSGGGYNPMTEALRAEQDYYAMQKEILDTIKTLEDKLAANTAEFDNCFDMTLTADLVRTKNEANTNIGISSTTLGVLNNLNRQYASSTDSIAKNSVLNTFVQLKNQGYFRSYIENQNLKLTFMQLTFAQWVDRFKYDMALEREDCGGSFDYVGVLTGSSTATSTRNGTSTPTS